MYASDTADDSERTAFRKAEKTYKLCHDQNAKSAKKKKLPRPVDLSEVIDFRSICEDLPHGVSVLKCDFDRTVFCLGSRPGALSMDGQSHWIRESLLSFPQSPNRTNHNAIYGLIQDLFIAAKERKFLVEKENLDVEENSLDNGTSTKRWNFSLEPGSSSTAHTCKSVSASVLLRKLRWEYSWPSV